MIESMPDSHLFKSSGTVTCQGQQIFYELLLNNTQYLIKFYDCLGKVRLIRPILLPAQNVEIHGVGEYLLSYQSSSSPEASGCFYLVQLSNLKVQTQKLNMNLECNSEQKVKIRNLHCNIEMRVIIFSDIEENVYILTIEQKDYHVTFLYKHDKEISELSIDQTGSVVITNKNGGIRVLEIDEIQLKVNNRKDWPNVIKYYRGDKFVVHYTKQREWRRMQDDQLQLQTNFLLINDEGADIQQFQIDKFIYEFLKQSEIIIKSGKKYLIVFNKTHNIIYTIFNGMQRVTNVEDNLMNQLEENNFLINFKTDQSFNVLLQIRVFANITEKFTLHQYEISKKENASHQNYLKRNLHNVYQFNGLILPLYERQVQKQLNFFINSLDQQKNSSQSRMISQESVNKSFLMKGGVSPYELGLTLLKVSFQHFPQGLDKLVRKIKNNIQFNKSVCYIEQTHRFFEYCEYILEQHMNILIGISRSIEEEHAVNGFLKSKDKDELQRIYSILENMINFLFGLNNALKIQVSDDEKLTTNKETNKKQQQRLTYYEKVYNIARSFFLIVLMLEDDQILNKFQARFRKIKENRKKINQIWNSNNQLSKLNYQPLFLHEHFEMIALFTKQQTITFTHLIKFMMTNRSNFLQNAYFYQSITKNYATPFLQTDICDLIQDISFNMPLMHENIELNQQNYKQKTDLLHKMTSIALKTGSYPFLKYMIQTNVCYQQFPLAVMLIFSESLKIPGGYDITENIKKQHIFMIKSLVISNRIDLALMYILENYDSEIFQDYLRLAQMNGNAAEVLDLYQKNFILNIEPNKLKEILQIDSNKWDILFGSETISNLSAKTS